MPAPIYGPAKLSPIDWLGIGLELAFQECDKESEKTDQQIMAAAKLAKERFSVQEWRRSSGSTQYQKRGPYADSKPTRRANNQSAESKPSRSVAVECLGEYLRKVLDEYLRKAEYFGGVFVKEM